jgi:hypothetical protein
MVSIPGGEPLMHSQIDKIVEGLVARKKYIYLCTNALLLKEKILLFKPSKYLTFSVHLDGQREEHDLAVCREGGYDIAVDAVREALKRGFRVTTNTTLFDGANPKSVRAFFDEMMELGVEGMMLSPGYSYDNAPDQKHFLGRADAEIIPRDPLQPQKELAVQPIEIISGILDGQEKLHLHAVGHAYLQRVWLAEAVLFATGRLRGHLQGANGFGGMAELRNGIGQSGSARIAWCTAATKLPQWTTVSADSRLLATIKAELSTTYADADALEMLNEPVKPVHAFNPLVQIDASKTQMEETRA